MGCTWSGLSALYGVVSSGTEVWVNERCFRIVRQLGEGGFSFVFLVQERPSGHHHLQQEAKDPSIDHHGDGFFALKKVLIQDNEQLDLVKQEIHVSSYFKHPNLLPLLDHAIIPVKGSQDGSWKQEAYLLFPVHKDGTLLDHLTRMQLNNEFYPTIAVLHIFKQICAGLKEMHMNDPPYAHNDMKPGNVLLTLQPNKPPKAVIMDFGSASPAHKKIRSRSEALTLQEWAAEHCSAPYRAPELWDCPSQCDIDERTDVWSLGCTLFAIMYRESPFEYVLGESGGSLQLAVMSGQVKWPPGPTPPYPDTLCQFVTWMVQPQITMRPHLEDVSIHIDKLLASFGTGVDGLWTLKVDKQNTELIS
ncbi:unnamed protein product [Sphagnum troendelagicum]|uniref:non-specific serine/threonine protein kinase n=1 Tax=Sphagnum troendelagicum TaxID=128251 RepID=A0ABP0UG53_9BRYO